MDNPFTDIKATEMSIEMIQELFAQPENIEKIYSRNAMFIEGQRGSGKTTVMRYIEHNPKYDDTSDTFEYIGVYYRFDRMIYGANLFSEDDTELFLHHLIIALIKRLVNQLVFLCDTHKKTISHIQELSTLICTSFFDFNASCHTLHELDSFLEYQRILTMKHIRNPRRVERPLICDYSGCLNRIAEHLHKETWLSNVTLLFLLDEYENLAQQQRQAINGLIKAASYGHTFKVFHRPTRLDMRVLNSDEHLMVQHDIMTVNFFEEIIGGDLYYPTFMKQLVKRRLQINYNTNHISYTDEDLNIEKYLTKTSVDEEFNVFFKKRNCIKKIEKAIHKLLPPNDNLAQPLINELANDIFRLRLFQSMLEKKLGNVKIESERVEIIREVVDEFRNPSKIYKGWVSNYRHAVLYLLCFENQHKKQTAGWEQILKISNGIARHVINIMYYTFEKDNQQKCAPFKRFSPAEQTAAVFTVGKKLFEDIIKVPVFGKAEFSMIQYLGRIFQIFHRDSTIKKWEVNHFIISKKGLFPESPSEKVAVDDVLDAAITWGHIIKRDVNKEKRKEELSKDFSAFHFHPLLCVYHGISWRQKQRHNMSYGELYAAAYNEGQLSYYINDLVKKTLGVEADESSIPPLWLHNDN